MDETTALRLALSIALNELDFCAAQADGQADYSQKLALHCRTTVNALREQVDRLDRLSASEVADIAGIIDRARNA